MSKRDNKRYNDSERKTAPKRGGKNRRDYGDNYEPQSRATSSKRGGSSTARSQAAAGSKRGGSSTARSQAAAGSKRGSFTGRSRGHYERDGAAVHKTERGSVGNSASGYKTERGSAGNSASGYKTGGSSSYRTSNGGRSSKRGSTYDRNTEKRITRNSLLSELGFDEALDNRDYNDYDAFGSRAGDSIYGEPAGRTEHGASAAGAFGADGLQVVAGRNPVIEVLAGDREVERVFIADGAEGSVSKIAAIAREKGVIVDYVPKERIDAMAPGVKHQGVAAKVSEYRYAELEDIFAKAEESGEDPFIIILDEIEDPHNLGAIIRTAECAGAHGVIIPKRRSASLTQTVALSAAGAIENMPVVQVTNLARTIEELQERGVWAGAADMDGETYYKANLTGPIAIVIGNEGRGVGRLVKEKCDFVLSIPMYGKINSLNASNAAAILMYGIRRTRTNE